MGSNPRPTGASTPAGPSPSTTTGTTSSRDTRKNRQPSPSSSRTPGSGRHRAPPTRDLDQTRPRPRDDPDRPSRSSDSRSDKPSSSSRPRSGPPQDDRDQAGRSQHSGTKPRKTYRRSAFLSSSEDSDMEQDVPVFAAPHESAANKEQPRRTVQLIDRPLNSGSSENITAFSPGTIRKLTHTHKGLTKKPSAFDKFYKKK